MTATEAAAPTDHRGRLRVAVTGIGVKTPAGQTVDELWDTLVAARPAAAPITLYDASRHSVGFACEVRGFDAAPYVGPKEVRRTDRAALLAVAAAADALGDATAVGMDPTASELLPAPSPDDLGADPVRCAVVAGSGIGGIRTLEDQVIGYAERGPSRVGPFLVPMMMPNASAALVAIRHGFTGPNLAIATACATGAHAIGEGARLLRDGMADVVVCGGTEASVSPVAMAAFARMGALSRNPDPAAASRPFDDDRDGFVMGEGAAFVVLEPYDRAVSRGARIHGEVLGYGLTCDAHHITAPIDDGSGAVAAIEMALADAGIAAGAIGHVNAHGTSTPQNDAAEAAAIAKVFGAGAVPVTSTKGVTGHLIGAAGAVEAVAALLAAARGIVPPTANHRHTDLPVDVVAGEPRTIEVAPAVSTSFAFGGHNAALVVGPA
ncbi:MAG TPA: beta-ketoacyl-ACP synthase II [Acidimicrobiales bacterium]|nr:beta-ketoacyl-ACP synthase II [Acidimicrobiales bacterium]